MARGASIFLRVVLFLLSITGGTVALHLMLQRISHEYVSQQDAKSAEELNPNLLLCLALITYPVGAGIWLQFTFYKAPCFTMSSRPRTLLVATLTVALVIGFVSATAIVLFHAFGSSGFAYKQPFNGLAVLFFFMLVGACTLFLFTRCCQHGSMGTAKLCWQETLLLRDPPSNHEKNHEIEETSWFKENDQRDRWSWFVCSAPESSYGCIALGGEKTVAGAKLLHAYSLLIPLGGLWIPYVAMKTPLDPASLLVFWMVYARMLNFWLKIDAFSVKPMEQLAGYWRSACFAWFIALNSSSFCHRHVQI